MRTFRALTLLLALPLAAACRGTVEQKAKTKVTDSFLVASVTADPTSLQPLPRKPLPEDDMPGEGLDRLAVERFTGVAMSKVLATASAILRKDGRKADDVATREAVLLEVAVAALGRGEESMAESLLDRLLRSKTPRVKAAALTALGLVAYGDERFADAARHWNDALRTDSDDEAARLNLGYLYLQFGAADKARSTLQPLKSNWLASAGLIVAARLLAQREDVDNLCKSVLAQKPQHAPTLVNCALAAAQDKRDYERAEALLDRAIKASGGSPELNERAYFLKGKVSDERARASRKAGVAQADR